MWLEWENGGSGAVFMHGLPSFRILPVHTAGLAGEGAHQPGQQVLERTFTHSSNHRTQRTRRYCAHLKTFVLQDKPFTTPLKI